MKNLEKEIKEIKERNKRVELDKRWETSLTRRLCICILTICNSSFIFLYN